MSNRTGTSRKTIVVAAEPRSADRTRDSDRSRDSGQEKDVPSVVSNRSCVAPPGKIFPRVANITGNRVADHTIERVLKPPSLSTVITESPLRPIGSTPAFADNSQAATVRTMPETCEDMGKEMKIG